MKSGIERINAERQRQIDVEGYTTLHDSRYENLELFNAGCCYYAEERTREICEGNPPEVPSSWPWSKESWKPSPDNRIRELEKAGALFKANYEINNDDLSYDLMLQCAEDIDKLLQIPVIHT